MFIELIDSLRCTADHAYIPLVASIEERDDRQVIEGILGCPTCRREYPIHGGIAWFGSPPEKSMSAGGSAPDADGGMRIGAFLNVSEGITIALVGKWARHATELSEAMSLRAFAINSGSGIVESERVAALYSANSVPFKDASLRGIAIDESGWSDGEIEMAARVLAPGGRMVAPAGSRVPNEIEELARDDAWWVGERRGALVALHRR
jgi:uncharacterized protein YbaR (Trm112 family)